jgi:two-component system heavy metal sensor histidine kinase CusS
VRVTLRSLSLRLGFTFALVSTLLPGGISLYLYQSLQGELAWRDDQALLGRLERVQLLLGNNPADLQIPQLTATDTPVVHQDQTAPYRLVIQRIEINQRSLTLIAGHLLAERQLMPSAYRSTFLESTPFGRAI